MKIDKHIIDKVLDNTASPKEAKLVADWFSTNEGQEYLSQRLTTESMMIGEKEVTEWVQGDIHDERMKKRFVQGIRKQQKLSLKWWKIAAVLIPFLILSSAAIFFADKAGAFSEAQYAEVIVPNGEKIQIILQDGTLVELNSATTLRYPKQFGLFSRKVELYGEAYFKVAKENRRPFTVQTNELEVQVTGTQFNAKAYPTDNQIYISLDEGSVLLKGTGNKKYPLISGESAVYDRRSGRCKITRPLDLNEMKAWRTNSLNFYMAPLKDIIKVMERQYDTQFIVDEPALLDSKYTLSTNKVNVTDVLHDLEKVSHIEFIKKGENIFEIRRKK